MNILKKAGASVAVSALVLTGCLGSPVVSYNNAATGAYQQINEAVGGMLDGLNEELDKDAPDFAKMDQIISEANTKTKAAIADIRALTKPEGESVDEFHTILTSFANTTEQALTVNDKFLAAVKAKDAGKVVPLAQQMATAFGKLDDLSEKLIAAQEVMAEKNNFELE